MYKALTNQILQSLAVSVRHREDFRRAAMNGGVSSQLSDPDGTAGGDMGTICGHVKANTRHNALRCVTQPQKRLSMVPALNALLPAGDYRHPAGTPSPAS
jgi:hypothetical protein